MEQPTTIRSPHGSYTLTLETREDFDVDVRLVRNDTSEAVLQYRIDNKETYIDEPGITEALFSYDEKYLVICNFYYNPILVWNTENGSLHFEIRDIDEVWSVELGSDSILRVEDGENNWVRWDLASRRRLD